MSHREYDVLFCSISVRLVGGSSSLEGRLEVLYDGVWNTVCDRYFYDEEARVVCNTLGAGYVKTHHLSRVYTRIRIQVSRTSNLYPDTSGCKGIHVAVMTILSPIPDTCRRRDTTCIWATCIRCKRGIT